MRILVIAACPLPWPRGTPIRIHRMAEALVERGHEVHLATYPLGDDSVETNYVLHRVDSSDAEMDPSPGPSLKKLFWLDPKLWGIVRRLLANSHFDVVHAHHYEGLLTALFARRFSQPVPVVYDAHTLLATELPHYRLHLPPKTVARFGAALDRSLPPRADHIITVTERMQQWFMESADVPSSQLSLIPNGVEHEHFVPPQAGQAQGGRPNGTNGHAPRIVFAGNLADYQGIGTLLDAFALLRSTAGNARLVLVTDSELDPWAPRIEELGIDGAVDVVHSDFDSLPMHLGEADVLVNPRMDCDGIPQKLLNYMAAGKPIVSFAGSAPVLEHGSNALVVPDADIDSFAKAILRVLRSPQLGEELGAQARRDAEEQFSWQRVARDVESAYARAVARARH
jgi:glycosyltransferase involved in cell wall biosynthesis